MGAISKNGSLTIMQPTPSSLSTGPFPLVSIALCVYNGSKFLRQQLDTLVGQRYPNLEIIAVDDCSRDTSREILQEYEQRFPFLKIYENEANLGYVKNFEKAISLCSGEYIALSDQDDTWDLDKIRIMVENIGTHKLVYHDSRFMEDSGEMMDKKMSDIIHLYSGDQPEVFYFFNCVSGHSCLFKRELIPDILPFHPEHFHDHWIAYVAVNLGTIGYVHKPLVNYRQHPTTSTDILNKRKKFRKNYHENRDIKKLRRDLKWIKYCNTFQKNKNADFLNRLHELFEKRLDTWFSFGYARLIDKHFDILFYIQKYRKSTKRAFVYRQIWGLKAKLLWARLFSYWAEEE
ncbi:glycosyltransferase [Dyadobacter sp. CY323]|nr:glycosyltransferase [Dyadobacter sp. CY323]